MLLYSCYLSISLSINLYILVISIIFDAIAPPRLGEKSKPNSLSNYEILQFRLWVPLKVVLTLIKVFLLGHLPTWCTRSSMYIVFIVYIIIIILISLVNIIILYYMQTQSLRIIKRIYCLSVCVIADSEYPDNKKPIFLFLEFFFLGKIVLGLCGSCSLLSHSAQILLAKLLI